MKKIVLITFFFLFLLILPTSANELDENILLHYGGGGVMIEFFEVEMIELNTLLKKNGFAPLDSRLWTYGGGFFSQTQNNLRYSNFGAGGSVSSIADNGKYACLSIGHGGVWLEQIFPLTDTVAVSLGGSTSLGRLKLELVHDTVSNFEEGITSPNQTVLKAPFIMIKPQIGFYYSLKRYVDLEFKVGYYYSHLFNWKLGTQVIPGEQPLEQMHGLSLLLNLNFGF
ncbi:hypothetical protein BBF96_05280 [Anoxybacter fermentans]|uniref:Outer membrane protein beta-barrel domain-containing protein n=1 Tax=Anoxybacter fermentans TaxID=1323375 RepID=A0A3Q9HPN4_9FIRM|nr:hypothetical protein [Anoxybacter fermentans]AZR72852.1 hypothetical protein BBF96_05280 [Anoxybacter fermentans]